MGNFQLPPCPACPTTSRRGRTLQPGLLRPGILLYNELDLRAQTIPEIIQHNLSLDVDLLLILGTSLIVHGIQKLTRKFAKLAHKNDGLVLYINQKGPPRKHWDGVVDYWVEWKCDAWVNDLTTRDRWLSTAGCLKSATIDDEVLRLERKRLAAEPDHIARHVRRRCKSAGDGRRRKALVGTRDFLIDLTGCTS